MPKTAVLIDGGFYLRCSRRLWNNATGKERAHELLKYASFHVKRGGCHRLEGGKRSLYRIFYYDCPPLNGRTIWQPWDGRGTTFGKNNDMFKWITSFQDELSSQTKVAMRFGTIKTEGLQYVPKGEVMKDIFKGKRSYDSLTQEDFTLIGMKQSGVDMKIGLDVSGLAQTRIVDQIVLIANDTDFIPAIKTARRAGVDFILDPMGEHVNSELVRQVDDIEDLSAAFDPNR